MQEEEEEEEKKAISASGFGPSLPAAVAAYVQLRALVHMVRH